MKYLQHLKSALDLRSKRGQAAGGWVTFGVALAISVVSFVVLAIMLGALRDSQTANSLPYNISQNGLTFLSNVTGQLGTAGTILGVSLLLVIIAGIGFAGYSVYKSSR
jgi:hypothetical protein